MLQVKDFQMNIFGVNTYVVWNAGTKEAMVVDPGMVSDAEEQRLADFITGNSLTVKYVVNTHLHLDHAFGNGRARRRWGVMPMAHTGDLPLGQRLPQQAAMFGIGGDFEAVTEVAPIDSHTRLTLGGEEIRVLECPGHSPGGIALYAPESGWVICGDSLFAGGGIGRTDLPGGDYGQLVGSLRDVLFTLPPDTVIYPGHGPASTIGEERR